MKTFSMNYGVLKKLWQQLKNMKLMRCEIKKLVETSHLMKWKYNKKFLIKFCEFTFALHYVFDLKDMTHHNSSFSCEFATFFIDVTTEIESFQNLLQRNNIVGY